MAAGIDGCKYWCVGALILATIKEPPSLPWTVAQALCLICVDRGALLANPNTPSGAKDVASASSKCGETFDQY